MTTLYSTYEEALTAGRLARAAVILLMRVPVRGILNAYPRAAGGFKFELSIGTLRIQSWQRDTYIMWDDQNPTRICNSLSELCDRVKIILF